VLVPVAPAMVLEVCPVVERDVAVGAVEVVQPGGNDK